MTTEPAAPDPDRAGSSHRTDLRSALARLREEARHYLAAKLDHWILQAEGLASPAGPADAAVVEGVEAAVAGENPLTSALKAAWGNADGIAKAELVALLLLVALLAPVVLLLTLLALLVAAAVARLKTAPAAT